VVAGVGRPRRRVRAPSSRCGRSIGCVHKLVASGAITALAGVVTDTAGQVKTATIATAAAAGTLIGTAVTTAAGSPLKLRVQGRR
jgi:hypothetical protein